MKDKKTNTIYFPHVIAGNTLDDKVYTFNNVNGGVKSLSDFNINPNKFLGGNCAPMIGLISEYGFYACPHFKNRKDIVAFYIDDPNMITPIGKQLIEKTYPSHKIIYQKMSPTIHKVLTPEELDRKKKLLAEIEDKGVNSALVQHSTIDELEGMISAIDSGKSNLKVEQEAPPRQQEEDTKLVQVKRASVPRKKG